MSCVAFGMKIWLAIVVTLLGLTHGEDTTNGYDVDNHFSSLYREYLNRMVRTLDDGLDACDDFFQHACGGMNGPVGEELSELVPQFLYNKEDGMHFFQAHYQQFGSVAGQILGSLYHDCKARFNKPFQRRTSSSPQFVRWQRMLLEVDFLRARANVYRDWPFMRFQWKKINERGLLNWAELAGHFAAHGVPSFFNIFFTDKTIYVQPPDDRVACSSVEEIRRSLLPLLRQRSPQVAKVIADELWIFCRELTGALPLSEEVSELLENDTNVLVDDTTVEYFQTFFARLNFSEAEVNESRKIPMSVERLSEVLTLLRVTEPRILLNYVLWRAYQSLMYDDCYLLTEEFDDLLQMEYWSWQVFDMYLGKDVAMAMYLFHTTRFRNRRQNALLGVHWDKMLLAQLERKDFNVRRLIGNYANNHLNGSHLEEVPVRLKRGRFYANLLLLRKVQLQHSFHSKYIDKDSVDSPAFFLQQFLHFSVLILKRPLFHYFATQGFDMWHMSNWLYTTDGLYTALDCLDQQSGMHMEDYEPNGLSSFEVERIFRFYRSFTETHNDYQFWLESESFAFAEEFILDYFQLNSERILFYAVAQLYCKRNDAFYSALINRSFMNMATFQYAFNCSDETYMNPIAKCEMRK